MSLRTHCLASALAAAAVVVSASPARAAVDCERYTERRVERFRAGVERAVTRCLRREARRGTPCPDERLTTELGRLRARVARTIDRRCPNAGAGDRLAAAEARVFCDRLELCPPRLGSITVRVTSGTPAGGPSGLATLAGETGGEGRRLEVDAGWTGLAHDLQILEGTELTAELSGCDGKIDTLCDLHGATAGTPFGAPSPISPGGVGVCVTVGFDSDLTGELDLVSGALTESAHIRLGVYLAQSYERPCPACVPADGDPQLGEAGTCVDGGSDGQPCTIEGLADPGYGVWRATSNDCPPSAGALIGEFATIASATTGQVSFATTPASPSCRAAGFTNQKCPCDTCNDAAATPCRSDADCAESGGLPGVCGGRRCFGGQNDGTPCRASSDCPDGSCGARGAATAPNSCDDGICSPTEDGGVCLTGPLDGTCAVEHFRGCLTDAGCPLPGDRCIFAPRRCFLDPTELAGTPDPPVASVAHPTLVGGFCLGSFGSAAADSAGGFPGPVTYVWPTELTLGE